MLKAFAEYAQIYDILYKEKDYDGECAFLKDIFKRYCRRQVKDILDVACGTGNHILPLASCGFSVAAQDISACMLKIARDKAKSSKLKIKFIGNRAMQDFKHDKEFDAVIAMFASIGYLTSFRDLRRALKNIRGCLRDGGIFIFDFWNKIAVRKYYMPHKENVYVDGNKKVIRVSDTILDNKNSVAKIRYKCTYFIKDKKKKAIDELHLMRYYTAKEVSDLLESCGFLVLDYFPFMHIGKRITEKTWNISMVATLK